MDQGKASRALERRRRETDIRAEGRQHAQAARPQKSAADSARVDIDAHGVTLLPTLVVSNVRHHAERWFRRLLSRLD